ncbi:MAG: molybdopterin-dependent oxidoreductase, partial [Pseudomonadota bacterium]
MNKVSRRTLITAGTISIGGSIFPAPFLRNLPRGISPLISAQTSSDLFPTKDRNLTVLGRRPVNIETPVHLLNDEVTPAEKMFVRNNGLTPRPETIDPSTWTLSIDGEVNSPQVFTIEELEQRFETVTLRLQLECGGNGRRFFDPGANGNQWTFGAVSCGE